MHIYIFSSQGSDLFNLIWKKGDENKWMVPLGSEIDA